MEVYDDKVYGLVFVQEIDAILFRGFPFGQVSPQLVCPGVRTNSRHADSFITLFLSVYTGVSFSRISTLQDAEPRGEVAESYGRVAGVLLLPLK